MNLNRNPSSLRGLLKYLPDKDIDTLINEFTDYRDELRKETKKKLEIMNNILRLARAEKRRRKRRKEWKIA